MRPASHAPVPELEDDLPRPRTPSGPAPAGVLVRRALLTGLVPISMSSLVHLLPVDHLVRAWASTALEHPERLVLGSWLLLCSARRGQVLVRSGSSTLYYVSSQGA